jgi:hypothetical protein
MKVIITTKIEKVELKITALGTIHRGGTRPDEMTEQSSWQPAGAGSRLGQFLAATRRPRGCFLSNTKTPHGAVRGATDSPEAAGDVSAAVSRTEAPDDVLRRDPGGDAPTL